MMQRATTAAPGSERPTMTTLDDAPDVRHSMLTAEAVDTYRRALLGYCYRMLGSAADADDAVQETMVRAWRGLDRFESRAPLEAWLYRIATNVCLNLLRGRRRRAMPMDTGPASSASTTLGAPHPAAWIEPMPDAWLTDPGADPADVAESRESVRLAFIASLQVLPATQRAVLILRDVLRWKADEVASLLDTTVVSVKSALQRARATLAEHPATTDAAPADPDLLDRYVDAFRRYDVDALVRLLRDDATLSMPPYDLWLQGPDDIRAWLVRVAADCGNSEFTPIAVNGTLGLIQHRPTGPGGPLEPYAVHVIEGVDGRVSAMHVFLDPVTAARFTGPNRAV